MTCWPQISHKFKVDLFGNKSSIGQWHSIPKSMISECRPGAFEITQACLHLFQKAQFFLGNQFMSLNYRRVLCWDKSLAVLKIIRNDNVEFLSCRLKNKDFLPCRPSVQLQNFSLRVTFVRLICKLQERLSRKYIHLQSTPIRFLYFHIRVVPVTTASVNFLISCM